MANVPLHAIPVAAHDDALFVRGAIHILSGQWLGPYDNLTLAKGPFYPMWIAVNWIAGLPLLVSQGLLYAVSCLVLARALRIWLRSEAATFGLFVLLLSSPLPFGSGLLRVMREGIYAPMTILIVGLAFWWWRQRAEGVGRRAALAAGTGLVLAAYWMTREEGMWLVPTLFSLAIAFVAPLFWPKIARPEAIFRDCALILLAFVVTFAGITGVKRINRHVYGVSEVVEFKQDAFIDAYAALARIKHRDDVAYVVVPREVLDRAFTAGPAAAELKGHFDLPGLVDIGCSTYHIEPCDGEFRAGWFMWALREATAQTGHYRSAKEAQAFYASVARDIDAACADGRLDCIPARRSLAPPLRWVDVRLSLDSAAWMVKFLASPLPSDIDWADHALSCLTYECGSSRFQAAFFDMTHSTVFIYPEGMGGMQMKAQSDLDGPLPYQPRLLLVGRMLQGLAGIYHRVLPIATGAAAICFPILLLLAAVRRKWDPILAVAALAAVTFASRVALLAYLDVVAIPSRNTLYLSPAFPFLLLFCFATLFAAARSALALRRQRRSKIV